MLLLLVVFSITLHDEWMSAMFLMLLLLVVFSITLHDEDIDETWLLEARELDVSVPTISDKVYSQGEIGEDICKVLMDYVVNNPLPN